MPLAPSAPCIRANPRFHSSTSPKSYAARPAAPALPVSRATASVAALPNPPPPSAAIPNNRQLQAPNDAVAVSIGSNNGTKSRSRSTASILTAPAEKFR